MEFIFDPNELIEVTSYSTYKIQNVSLVLMTGMNYGRILTVTEKRGTVGFPGGKIDASDLTVFDAMKREYKEETGYSLPRIENIRRFVYHGHTAIYLATTTQILDLRLGPDADGEIKSMNLTRLTDIKLALDEKASFKLRLCVKKSTKLLFHLLGL